MVRVLQMKTMNDNSQELRTQIIPNNNVNGQRMNCEQKESVPSVTKIPNL